MKNKYNIIYIDPPWSFQVKIMSSKQINDHYQTMSNRDIIDLPIQDLAAKDCALFLWTTHAHLSIAVECMENWGFKYKTVAFEWLKFTKPDMKKICCGMGKWTNGYGVELCLLGVKGHPKRIDTKVRKMIAAARTRHSAKPPETRDRIVQLMGDLPRVELFARDQVDGWDRWGNEVDSNIELAVNN